MLGTRCAAAGGVLVRNRRCTGTTIMLLPLFLLLRFKFPADAPRDSRHCSQCLLLYRGCVRLG